MCSLRQLKTSSARQLTEWAGLVEVWVSTGFGELQNARLERSRAFLPVPGVMQTVQCAEFWGAVVAMQAYWPCHLGIDHLNVAGTIGRLVDKDCLVKLLLLIQDGDWSLLSKARSALGVGKRFVSLRLKGMLRIRMCNMVGFGWRINWGTLRLILPLTWVVVISLKLSLMLGAGCSKCVVIGTL